MNTQYDDDNERLSELGERAFEMAVSFGLFSKRPMLTREEISVSCCVVRRAF